MYSVIRTIYTFELNKEFGSKFSVSSCVWHKTPEEDRRTHRPKHCEFNNEDEDNNPNTLSAKNYQASSQKIWQINCLHIGIVLKSQFTNLSMTFWDYFFRKSFEISCPKVAVWNLNCSFDKAALDSLEVHIQA